jgi:hypothetical protein
MIDVIIIFAIIYVSMLVVWWLLCLGFSKSAIRSSNRYKFDFVEMLDIGLVRLWRLFEFALLASMAIWGWGLGFWWLIPIALILMARLYFFVSFFYIPFNLIESRYAARVEYFFGSKNRAKQRKDKEAQIKKMKENNWTIPDKMK